MPAGTYDMTIEQGIQYAQPMVFTEDDGTPIPMDGWTGKMQIRRSTESADVLLEISTGDGITIGASDGTILIEMSAELTGDLTVPDRCKATLQKGREVFQIGIYDLVLTDNISAEPFRLLQGTVFLSPRVTR